MRRHSLVWPIACALAAALSSFGCGNKATTEPAVATPGVKFPNQRVPLGSPLEITYRFAIAPSAPKHDQKYRVLVHFLDSDEELMWTDDHDPPIPTTEWRPGQTVEYQRTMFVPLYPYVGEATVQMGLYSTTTQKRLPLAGEDRGQQAYKVATLQIVPQTENIFLIFKDGWHPAEVAEGNSTVEWQWTKKEATLSFRNPKRDSMFYLHLDNPGGVFQESQKVEVRSAGQLLDSFLLAPRQELIRKAPLTATQLGTAEMAELKIHVDKTFVPALAPAANSRDPRELGVRVFHAFVEPRE